jgi:hypothetical protein
MSKNILEQVNQLIYKFMQEQDCDDELYKSWKGENYQNELIELLKKPKRAKSAYLFFCQANRQDIKDEHPEMKSTEVTSELGRLWKELKADKEREEELAEYLELARQEKEKLGIPIKEKKVSTRAKSAYLFFCQANRQDIKDEYPDIKSTEITSKLAEMWKELKNDSERSDELADYERMASEDKERVSVLPKKEKGSKTAYIFFCEMNRPDLKDENPEMSGKEITKTLSILWKELKDDLSRRKELEEYQKLSDNYIPTDENVVKKNTKSSKPKSKKVEKNKSTKIDKIENTFVVKDDIEKEIYVKKSDKIPESEVVIKKGNNITKGSNLKAYNNFRSKKITEMQQENSEISKIQMEKTVRNLWQNMDEDEKNLYN